MKCEVHRKLFDNIGLCYIKIIKWITFRLSVQMMHNSSPICFVCEINTIDTLNFNLLPAAIRWSIYTCMICKLKVRVCLCAATSSSTERIVYAKQLSWNRACGWTTLNKKGWLQCSIALSLCLQNMFDLFHFIFFSEKEMVYGRSF